MSSRFFILLIALLGFSFSFGCTLNLTPKSETGLEDSDDDDDDDDDQSDQPSSEPSGEPSSNPSSEPSSNPSSEPSSSQDCSDSSSFDECFQCLANENPGGYEAYVTAVISNCFCGNECGSVCGDFCSGASDEPTAECQSCFDTVAADQNSECIQGFSADCGASADCVDFANGLGECP